MSNGLDRFSTRYPPPTFIYLCENWFTISNDPDWITSIFYTLVSRFVRFASRDNRQRFERLDKRIPKARWHPQYLIAAHVHTTNSKISSILWF